MGLKETENEIIIEMPNLSPPIRIIKSQIVKMEEDSPPDEICRAFMNFSQKGVILAGTTIDGKVSYYNIHPGERCLKIVLKDGRTFFVGSK
jgi:hypothetical protein